MRGDFCTVFPQRSAECNIAQDAEYCADLNVTSQFTDSTIISSQGTNMSEDGPTVEEGIMPTEEVSQQWMGDEDLNQQQIRLQKQQNEHDPDQTFYKYYNYFMQGLWLIILVLMAMIGVETQWKKLKGILARIQKIEEKVIMIVGSDTRFERDAVLKLLDQGFPVVACHKSEKGMVYLEELAADSPGTLYSIELDLLSEDSLEQAVEWFDTTMDGKKLYGLIINSKTNENLCGPNDFLTLDDYKTTMDYNFFGILRLFEAFKPRIKLDKTRIVVRTNTMSKLAAVGQGPVSASEHALDAYLGVYRKELEPYEVSIHQVEVGAITHPFIEWNPMKGNEMVEFLWSRAAVETQEEYGVEYRELLKSVVTSNEELMKPNRRSLNQQNIALLCIQHAMISNFPLNRYPAGLGPAIATVVSFLPRFGQDMVESTIRNWANKPSLPIACERRRILEVENAKLQVLMELQKMQQEQLEKQKQAEAEKALKQNEANAAVEGEQKEQQVNKENEETGEGQENQQPIHECKGDKEITHVAENEKTKEHIEDKAEETGSEEGELIERSMIAEILKNSTKETLFEHQTCVKTTTTLHETYVQRLG